MYSLVEVYSYFYLFVTFLMVGMTSQSNWCGLFQNVAHLLPVFLRLHGEVGHVGVGGDLELEDGLGGGGAPVEHGAEDPCEGVARHDGGLDGQLLDERFGLLQRQSSRTSPASPGQDTQL